MNEQVNGYNAPKPVPAPYAFELDSRDAYYSQAAFLMATGLILSGYMDALDEGSVGKVVSDADDNSQFPLPDPIKLAYSRRHLPERVLARHGVDFGQHIREKRPSLALNLTPRLAANLLESPNADDAIALIELSTHHSNQIVRTGAAVASSCSLGLRSDTYHILEEGIGSADDLIHQVAAAGMARAGGPFHSELVTAEDEDFWFDDQMPPTDTAFITHGTWANGKSWWQPGGAFYQYVGGLQLNLHTASFGWSGSYRHRRRQVAAIQMLQWMNSQGLSNPDILAHSHGGTVAHLATKSSAVSFDRLILLSWPARRRWMPDFNQIGRVIDIRLNFDLVILADRGGQRFRAPSAVTHKVTSIINGWFRHGDTHDPGYWIAHSIPSYL